MINAITQNSSKLIKQPVFDVTNLLINGSPYCVHFLWD